ncbi:MAG: hypothetical protein WD045_00735, partial [Pirellulaceae bacterium]
AGETKPMIFFASILPTVASRISNCASVQIPRRLSVYDPALRAPDDQTTAEIGWLASTARSSSRIKTSPRVFKLAGRLGSS